MMRLTPSRFIAPTVTADELRTARNTLGLTQHGLAEALRMGKWGWQTISKWENGSVPVPGPAQVAIEMLVKERI
jgi:DNA-binding transcriptional regulator YiaG